MKKILVFAAFVLSSVAHAQDINASSFDRFMHKSLGGGLHTISMASNGTPIAAERISSLTPGGGWVNAGQMSVATHPDGLEVRGRAQIPVSPGTKIPVNVSSIVSRSSILASMQRCMGNLACFAAFNAGTAALGIWLENSGILVNPSPTSANDLFGLANDPSYCSINCYWWSSYSIPGQFPSPASLCTAYIAIKGTPGTFAGIEMFNPPTGFMCLVKPNNGGPNTGINFAGTRGSSRAPDSVNYTGFNNQHLSGISDKPIPNDILIPLLQAQYKAGNESGYGAPAYSEGVKVQKTTVSADPVVTPANGQKTITTEKIVNADGTTSTKETTKQTSYQVQPSDDGLVKVTPVTTTTVKIDGQEVPELGKTEQGKPIEQQDIETCGLPNTPPCKINEEGTPEAQQDTHKKDVDDALADLKRLSTNPATFWPTFPQIRWDFALPTGCAAISIPAFSPFLQEIDVCQFQPIFHDIMSAVWVLGGLFGAISIFWRSTFAKAA